MQPNKVSPLAMFTQPLQYLVPIFQRGYVWSVEKQIQPLWSDILDRAEEVTKYVELERRAQETGSQHLLQKPRKHFLGTIIITDYQSAPPGEPQTSEVIDGQQRMTTSQLLALAFRDAVQDYEDTYLRESLATYTRNPANYKQARHQLKVWPTNAGREDMKAIYDAGSFEAVCNAFPLVYVGTGRGKKLAPRPLMVEAYMYFFGVISMFLRGKLSSEVLTSDDKLEALLSDEELLPDRTWSDYWVHRIRHDNLPVVPFAELAVLEEQVPLLIATLTEYLQLIELRLGVEDDAQVIFETLNDRGEKLTPADLVRNFVFLQATRKNLDAPDFYNDYWKPFDEEKAEPAAGVKSILFWKVQERQGRLTNTRLDTLLYHYVSMRTMEDVKLDHVFESFKQWWSSSNRDLGNELSKLNKASDVFRCLVVPNRSTAFGRFGHNIRVLDSTTLIPAVLLLAERLGVSSPTFLKCLTVLESYLVRRAVCGLTTKAYNRIFPGLVKVISAESDLSDLTVAEYLAGLGGHASQNWPTDEEFKSSWTSSQTYKLLRAGKTKMVLEAIELGLRNDKYHETSMLPTGELHVEHVLPQKWQECWPLRNDLPEAMILREAMLHNFGNLTLLTEKLNPALSNMSFDTKRPEITQSLLALNAYFQPSTLKEDAEWNEEAIATRSKALFKVALKTWPRAAVEAQVEAALFDTQT